MAVQSLGSFYIGEFKNGISENSLSCFENGQRRSHFSFCARQRNAALLRG
jgi:hypothetical protein